ncbi:hypothetical protein HID58_049402 [Brassica napus]|uniref:Uncharacterized protein n=1 Tax=Brassica napus TaxID=3708 RepID=A0ABQ8B4V6_BRANA|nr:hypothetical protein HID58_049402 [Brassica napus]
MISSYLCSQIDCGRSFAEDQKTDRRIGEDLCDFVVTDEAKYPTISPLKEVVDNIQSQVAKQNQCDRSHRRYIPILSCISLKNVYASFVFILIY